MLLTDAVAIITGGKRIGRVVARELAERGVDLVLSYRGSRAEAEATAGSCSKHKGCRGGRVHRHDLSILSLHRIHRGRNASPNTGR